MVYSCKVYTELAQTAAVPSGTSHVTTEQRYKYTTSVNVQKRVIDLESHASAVSPIESGQDRRTESRRHIHTLTQ